MPNSSNLSYCGEQVRRLDRDRYLTCLFVPQERREASFALLSFNHDIAKTSEVVSEPMLGQIRLQWWREAIADMFAKKSAPAHEALDVLVEAAPRYGLSEEFFQRIISTREQDLFKEAPPTLEDLERYAEGTSSTLVWLQLQVLGAFDETTRRVGRHVGIAWALAGILRAVPYHARQQRILLPADHLTAAKAERKDILEGRGSDQVSGVVMRLANRAREHLETAREERAAVPRAAIPALLISRLTERYLKLLERNHYDPFDPKVLTVPASQVWHIGWSGLRGRY